MMTHAELKQQSCQHQIGAATQTEIAAALAVLSSWKVEHETIIRQFAFKNYYQTLEFVNTIANIIHQEDHHPELLITYNRCTVRFNTHSVNDEAGGLSHNDFICAAKIDAVFEEKFLANNG
jgi:4a-hydroxytetrahydrobiopterin dehydratase